MNSQNQYDAGVAMVGLSCFISPDLARDLANDIMNMVQIIMIKKLRPAKFLVFQNLLLLLRNFFIFINGCEWVLELKNGWEWAL